MFNRIIIAVVGTSNSGKTTAIESIIEGLTKEGYLIATVKHIPEKEFTIDTQGKDTWRYAEAGANIVLSVAPKELAVIKKVDTRKYTLEKVVENISYEADIIIIEGFKTLIRENMAIPKIVATKNDQEILQAIGEYKNILAFVGPVPNRKLEPNIPCIDIIKDKNKLVNLVNEKIAILVERKRNREKKITIQIEEKLLPLGDFVQNIIRNSVLAMVSSLKGVKINGDEKVSIIIKRFKGG
jgi:molybdopterin-guanine dinucleotide biosynthesis protein MobB